MGRLAMVDYRQVLGELSWNVYISPFCPLNTWFHTSAVVRSRTAYGGNSWCNEDGGKLRGNGDCRNRVARFFSSFFPD